MLQAASTPGGPNSQGSSGRHEVDQKELNAVPSSRALDNGPASAGLGAGARPVSDFMPSTPLQGEGRYAAAAEAAALTSPDVTMGTQVVRGEGLLSGAAAMLGVDLAGSMDRHRGNRAQGNHGAGSGLRLSMGAAANGTGLFGGRRLSVSSAGSRSVGSAGSDVRNDSPLESSVGSVARYAVRSRHAEQESERVRTEAAATAMAASALRLAKRDMMAAGAEVDRPSPVAGQTPGLAEAGSPVQDKQLQEEATKR